MTPGATRTVQFAVPDNGGRVIFERTFTVTALYCPSCGQCAVVREVPPLTGALGFFEPHVRLCASCGVEFDAPSVPTVPEVVPALAAAFNRPRGVRRRGGVGDELLAALVTT